MGIASSFFLLHRICNSNEGTEKEPMTINQYARKETLVCGI